MSDEGYIKYKCARDKRDCIQREQISELIAIRNMLQKRRLIGVYPDGVSYGNISKRLSDKEFIISGSQTGAVANLDYSHFAKVTSWNIQKNEIKSEGLIPASSESLSHAAVYQSDIGINAVIHIHNKKLWTELKGFYPTTSANAQYGSKELALEILKIIENNISDDNIIILSGHEDGIIVYGSNLDNAMNRLIDLTGNRLI